MQVAPFAPPEHVVIIGLGLMGGSLALALRPHVARLTAVDANPLVCRYALTHGVVDAATTDFEAGVMEGDLIIFATPVRVIERLLAQLGELRPAGCQVIDLGSTKTAIGAAMDALPITFEAIGGHPMCGKETAGIEAALADLYEGQTFITCSTTRTTPRVEATASWLIGAIGSKPMPLEAAQHDGYVAVVSHLPYVVAATLVRNAALAAENDPRVWQVSASGFRDTGRLAGSEPRMMLDILLTNKDAVLPELRRFRRYLDEIERLIEAGDEIELRSWLSDRQFEYGIYRSHKRPR